MEKVAAAKQYIENHYKAQNKNIQERKERRWILERKLASSGVPKEEQINMIKDLERKETEFMRLKRNKISVDDFELLTIIGRGAFGEVCTTDYYLSLLFSLILAARAFTTLPRLVSGSFLNEYGTFNLRNNLILFTGSLMSGEKVWKYLCHEEVKEI
jgi:hypothetical protein